MRKLSFFLLLFICTFSFAQENEKEVKSSKAILFPFSGLDNLNANTYKIDIRGEGYLSEKLAKRVVFQFNSFSESSLANPDNTKNGLVGINSIVPTGVLGKSNLYTVNQESNSKFTKASLVDLKKTGKSLQWSFYSKYGANILGLIETLSAYSGSGSGSNDVLIDLSKRSSFQNMLGLGSYALELHSINYIGRSGLYLQSLSSRLSTDNAYLLNEASLNLKKARTYGFISTGLGIIGTTASMYGFGHDIDSDAFGKGLIIGSSFALGSIIFKFISVNNVEGAGIKANQFSQKLTEDWQKSYFDRYANGLQDYKKHWRKGFSLTLTGIGIVLVSALVPSETVTRIGVYAGGISFIAGNIYMNWVAPYSLGSAGESLTDLENRLQ